MDNRLGRDDWLRAARLALLRQGPEGVRVEPLARDLDVTKGSFYWHFRDREDLLATLLDEWEAETALLTKALEAADPAVAIPAIIDEQRRLSRASERGESPSDAAIFAWAATDPKVARRANKVEKERMALFRRITGRPELADLFFYAYHGFLLRRRRVPEAAGDFELIGKLALRMLMPPKQAKPKRRSPRRNTALGLLLGVSVLQGCTTYRIVRWRDPAPNVQHRIFPERIVAHAPEPFTFVTASPLRTDLDTVPVRDIDGQLKPFATYLAARRIKAFLVIRNDTILYERYRDGYSASTRSSSFSVAKSVTAALLGVALRDGAVKSLDDPVTTYVPELRSLSEYSGVTVRQLLGMKSGFAYSRTNGSLWHDFRSDDAHFYYTTNRHRSLMDMRREDPPGARWAYKDSDTEMIGWVLSNATGKSLARQLEESIWKRIGTEADASWTLDRPGGSESASSGLNATARDFARFGRLFLHEGRWQGQEIVPRDWVMTSTSVDRSRDEPEVTTWFRMQHQQYWWIPMHNWEAERDFFADGSKGQRLYVHRPSRTIIVQLADDSDQEFPFRKVVHYLAGEPFRYPTPIPALLLRAGRTVTPDSLRALYRQLSARERANPAELVINEGGMIAVGIQLTADAATRPTGLAVLELSVERSPRSYRSRDALGDALLAAGDRQKAIEQYRRSVELAPFSTYAREKLAELERRP